jgi:molecular chaperone GrpE
MQPHPPRAHPAASPASDPGSADPGPAEGGLAQAGRDQAGRDQADRDQAAPDVSAELEDRLRRALADLENLRKRHARDRERERLAETKRLAAAWLPVLDNLDLALGYAGTDSAAVVQGVRAVRDQALAVLTDLGFARLEEVGVPFDPARHEVVDVVDDARVPPGTVLQVLRPGYGEAERQLRPAAVTVAGRRDR